MGIQYTSDHRVFMYYLNFNFKSRIVILYYVFFERSRTKNLSNLTIILPNAHYKAEFDKANLKIP